MNLKRIEIYGFKSFADKIELKFDYPITGIVGPNGCGKSNVSDCIRWVLGEQSAKLLRGKTMQDLIFGGTEKRKSMSYCEASLIFDNKQRIFPIEMDEIIISRKLYRNNESEYYLNKNICRLKDISDLLRGVGLGREGYSIVGQGRMDAILNSKPEDRRAIFEEALGISKFRVRKVETERKLDKTKDNMSRLYDILTELDRQLSPLKKQSEDAKKYLDLKEKLKYQEINSYIYSYDNASSNKEKCKDKLKGLAEEYNRKNDEYSTAFEHYDELFNQINDTDKSISLLREEQLQLSIKIERLSGETKLFNERVKHFTTGTAELSQIVADNKSQIQEVNQRIVVIKKQLDDKRVEHANLTERLVSLNEKYVEMTTEIDKYQQQAEVNQGKVVSTLSGLTDHKSRNASLASERITLSNRILVIEQEEAELTAKLKSFSDDEKQLAERYEKHALELKTTDNNIHQSREEMKLVERQLFDVNSQYNKAEQRLAVSQTRLNMLVSLAESFKGYSDSVKSLLSDSQNNASIADKICGVVANIIKVPEQYETAIETALGNSLQNIITKDEQDTKFLINYLKLNRYGRVTFLPISSMKPRRLERTEVLREKGVVGIAQSLVGYDKKFESVTSALLGSTLVVDNIDNAVLICRKFNYAHRIVTLDGELFSPQGSVQGGSKKVDSINILSSDREIAQEKERCSQLSVDISTLLKQKKEIETKIVIFNTQIEALNKFQQQCVVEINKVNELVTKSGAFSDSDRQQLQRISIEKQKTNQRLALIAKEETETEIKIKEQIATQQDDRDIASKTQVLYQELYALREKLQEEITSIRLKSGVLSSNIQIDEQTVQSDLRILNNLNTDTAQKTAQINENNRNVDELYKQIEEQSGSADDSKKLTEVSEKLNDADMIKIQLQTEFSAADQKRLELSAEVTAVNDQISKEEFNLSRIDDDIAILQQHVQEEYDITYSSAMRYKDEQYDIGEAKAIINSLKNSIARLGYVNVNAINDFVETQLRYDDISAQLVDLKKAEADLKEILLGLTKEMVVRFNDGFAVINANFGAVFKELFSGGHAEMTIEREEGKDELDFGIEIEAQPPGKKLQNISLLSGGERTLIGSAILFAILKSKPMPFCVLDEIEAALDDANAERISKFLRKFSQETQFIVITHKKPTMENADVLFGVTMEEKGVSKVVSVQLTEAIKQAI